MKKIIAIIVLLVSASFAQTYNRNDWGASWADADKDCQNTRQEVLIQESLIPVTLDSTGCILSKQDMVVFWDKNRIHQSTA